MIQKTLLIIKPDVYSDFGDEIVNDIIDGGFEIVESRESNLDTDTVKKFFSAQKENVSEILIGFMISKPVNIIVLQKENAIKDLNKLVGNKNPSLAEKGTIRRLYGVDKIHNAVYCSENIKEADWDIKFFFNELQVNII